MVLIMIILAITVMIAISIAVGTKVEKDIIKSYGCNYVFKVAYGYDKMNRLQFTAVMIFDDRIMVDRRGYILFDNIKCAEADTTKNIVRRRGNSMYMNPYREATTYVLRITFKNKIGSDDTLLFGCESAAEYAKYKQIAKIVNNKVGYVATPKEISVEEL